MRILQFVGCLLGLLTASLACALELPLSAEATLRFASNEWPPFVSASLLGDGLVGSLTSTVFKQLGYAVRIDYLPWKRSVQFGMNQPGYSGVLAVWRTSARGKDCYFSAPFSSTQTVLAHIRETPLPPLPPLHADQRHPLTIGTVAGYANGEQFDAMVQRGIWMAEDGLSDENNLKKLFLKRFPAIVIEKHVLQYLLRSDNVTRADRERIVIDDSLFPSRSLYVCFQHNRAGRALQQQFNGALNSIDLVKFEKNYWHKIGADLLPEKAAKNPFR